MIGRPDQQQTFRPGINLLKQNRDQSLELANLRGIIAMFGD